MATHSSVLAWRIPAAREPGGLLSMGLHRVRYDWSDLAAAAGIFVPPPRIGPSPLQWKHSLHCWTSREVPPRQRFYRQQHSQPPVSAASGPLNYFLFITLLSGWVKFLELCPMLTCLLFLLPYLFRHPQPLHHLSVNNFLTSPCAILVPLLKVILQADLRSC